MTGTFAETRIRKGRTDRSRVCSAVPRSFCRSIRGDPETPGFASTMDLDPAKRIPQDKLQNNQPSIPVNPLSYKDAQPILAALGGKETPRDWQGGLPFTYHLGAGGGAPEAEKVTVHMHLEQETKLRTIWDVIGTIEGIDPAQKDDWVVAATIVMPGCMEQSIEQRYGGDA